MRAAVKVGRVGRYRSMFVEFGIVYNKVEFEYNCGSLAYTPTGGNSHSQAHENILAHGNETRIENFLLKRNVL